MHSAHERGSGLPSLAVLIPAWQPGPQLLGLAAALSLLPFAVILVVDDGSAPAFEPVFQSLRDGGVPVLRHTGNRGKGRALKTGFRALLTDYPDVLGVVTADADGQHTPADIARVAQALASDLTRPVLGTRTFSGSDPTVPWRSRLGNALTRVLFNAGTGTRIHDTQSGLRGLPASTLPALLTLEGERYEYEMMVLAHLCRHGAQPAQVPIQTVYIDRNRGSHFNPLRDSLRISFVLARLLLSSLLAAGIDLLFFGVCFAIGHNLL